jgi:NTE family protein
MHNKNKQPLIALSLSGGGAKTFAHLGVMDAFKEANIPIDYLATSSASSVVGLMAALDIPSQEIIKEFGQRRKWLKFVRGSMFKQVLKQVLKEKKITNLDQTNIPISMVTVDIKTGQEIVFEKGDPLAITLGSCAFPGIFKPIKYKKYYLVDGGVLNPDPADVARKKVGPNGIVVSITLRLELIEENPGNRLNTILKTTLLPPYKYRDKIIRENSDIIITPLENFKISFSNWKKTFLSYFSNDEMKRFYKKGYKIGQQFVPEIKKLIQDKKNN